MAMKLNCSIMTPERKVYEGEVDFAVVQAYDGEVGFLYNHAPLIAELGTGEVRLRTTEKTDFFFVDGGFVEIKDNNLIILAQEAATKDEIDEQLLESKIKELKALPKPEKFEERIKIDIELKKIKARLKVSKR